MNLNLLVLRAKDPLGLARFYEALGMSFKLEKHGNGPEHLTSSSDGSTFEIYPILDDRTSIGTRLGFQVSDLAEAFGKAVEANAEVVRVPASSPWGKRAVFRDPEGHVVELTESDPFVGA